MDRSVTQALSGLIPSLNGPLPPELVELAVSLLAQSRSKASNLKADEEIARSYACANLACERLKRTLDLPKIQPRPPCPPKVYQKLYKYLDSALPVRTRGSNRPSRLKGTDPTPTSSTAKPRKPSKPAHVRLDTSKRKTPQRPAARTPDTPKWIMPATRQMCNRMEAPAAPHHIFAGVSSILSAQSTNSNNSPATESSMIKTPALIVAVYVYVTTRLAGSETLAMKYQQQRNSALAILEELADIEAEMKNVESADVDHCMRIIRDKRWTDMDWFDNVPAGIDLDGSDGLEDAAEDEIGPNGNGEGLLLPVKQGDVCMSEASDQHYLQAGLGTMMQNRVDYLSDDRRREYKEWKKSILLEIEELKKSQGIDLEDG